MTKRKILRSIAAAAICCCTLATAAAADCIGGASTTTEVNLRSGAGTDNSIIFTASTGTPMIVYGILLRLGGFFALHRL